MPVYLHRDDQFLYDAAPQQAAFFGLHCGELPPIDRYYDPTGGVVIRRVRGQRASHAGTLSGRRLPGHRNAGSPKRDLFVGDTLFAGSIGRTDLPGGDYPTLIRSITQVLFPFGDDATGVFRPRPANDDRPGAPHQSVPALGACPSNSMGRVPSAASADARRRDAGNAGHWRGAATPQMPARRRNPEGASGVAGELVVARRRRCPTSPPPSRLDLASQAPCARPMLLLGQAPRA